MVNKQEIADSLQVPMAALIDSIRYIRISGTIDDAAVLVVGGTATVAVFVAPYACKLTGFTLRAETLETADGTINLVKVASGTAVGSGTSLITLVVPTTAGGMVASTNYNCNVLTASNVNHIAAGEVVAILIGTVGEMTGLMYNAVFERL